MKTRSIELRFPSFVQVQRLRDMDACSDSELIKFTLESNKNAFESLVRRYQKLVYNVVYQMVQDHQITADITQESFIKAYRALNQFDRERNFKPWLLKIATNSALSHLNQKPHLLSLEQILEEEAHMEPSSCENVEAKIELELSTQEVYAALIKLPIRQREVFVLRFQHDLSHQDIAEITGYSVSSIKSLLFRARENLVSMVREES